MKAFKVFYYESERKFKSITLLAEDDLNIEVLVSQKDSDYKIGDKWSEITNFWEIPLSTVLITELSATELLALIKQG